MVTPKTNGVAEPSPDQTRVVESRKNLIGGGLTTITKCWRWFGQPSFFIYLFIYFIIIIEGDSMRGVDFFFFFWRNFTKLFWTSITFANTLLKFKTLNLVYWIFNFLQCHPKLRVFVLWGVIDKVMQLQEG